MFNREERARSLMGFDLGFKTGSIVVAGMDEVGRGPLAGPVVVACVVMPPEPLIPYINDSKKVSEINTKYGALTTVNTNERTNRCHVLIGRDSLNRFPKVINKCPAKGSHRTDDKACIDTCCAKCIIIFFGWFYVILDIIYRKMYTAATDNNANHQSNYCNKPGDDDRFKNQLTVKAFIHDPYNRK